MRLPFTTDRERSVPATIDLEHLGLDSGGHLLIERALAGLVLGARLRVRGTPPRFACISHRGAGPTVIGWIAIRRSS
jgi:hypothetical protein